MTTATTPTRRADNGRLLLPPCTYGHRPCDDQPPCNCCKDCAHDLTWTGPGPGDWEVAHDDDECTCGEVEDGAQYEHEPHIRQAEPDGDDVRSPLAYVVVRFLLCRSCAAGDHDCIEGRCACPDQECIDTR